MNKRLLIFSLAFIILVSFLSGCSPAVPLSSTPSPDAPAVSPTPVQATLAPSPTPAPGKVILVAAQGEDPQPVQAVLTELSATAGWVVEPKPGLQSADLTPDVKMVVLLAVPANLAELVAAAPGTQFLVVASADVQPAANLTVIRQKLENQAFVAGFIGVLLSTDFRAAGLLPSDGSLGPALKDAFINGGRYFCGVCAPGWPLRLYYPQVAEAPAGGDGLTWQAAAADLFDNQKAEVVYIAPEANRPEVQAYLQGKVQETEKTVLVLGTQAPPDVLRSQWAASVHFDTAAALRQAWTDVSTGKGGMVVDSPLVVDNVNSDLLGAGRMRLVNDLLDALKAGKVYPLTIAIQ